MRIGPERYGQALERTHVRPDGLHRPAVKGLEVALAIAQGCSFLEIGTIRVSEVMDMKRWRTAPPALWPERITGARRVPDEDRRRSHAGCASPCARAR